MSIHECHHCGKSPDLPYECNYCGGYYCPDHRLPEGHDCDGVEFLSHDQRWFREKESGNIVTSAPSVKEDHSELPLQEEDGPIESKAKAGIDDFESGQSLRDQIKTNKVSDFQGPESITPEYTVGSTSEPDFESSPKVEVKPGDDNEDEGGFLSRLFQRFLGR